MHQQAVITGGASGIGLATVNWLLQHDYQVWVLDKQPLPKSLSQTVQYSSVDLAEPSEIEQACHHVVQTWSQLNGLVNCAGVYPSVRLDQYTSQLWHHCMAVNATAPFLVTTALLPLLRQAKHASVVNVTSGAVELGSRDPGYSASKAALAGLTKSLAKNLAADQIRVNAVSPGPIDTPMSQAGMRPKDVKEYQKNILLQRFGKPEEVASAIGFLLSAEAEYITGSTVHINGGLYCN